MFIYPLSIATIPIQFFSPLYFSTKLISGSRYPLNCNARPVWGRRFFDDPAQELDRRNPAVSR
jgi:hypothetical protein